jgi:hypothetical protein
LWFPPILVPVGCGQVRKPVQLPVLTMVCAYSRWLMAVLIPARTAADLFAAWWGAVPRVLVWDGEGAIGRSRAGRPGLTGDCQAFRGTLGEKMVAVFLLTRRYGSLPSRLTPAGCRTVGLCSCKILANLSYPLASNRILTAASGPAVGCMESIACW